jgi:tetratricopeptide (TPR) repeat protein
MALYDAFISYSHAKDKPIAAALQSVIQKLGKPWYRRRALRVFRDDTSLSATSLWPTIEQALGQSRFLIVLASPEAAASQSVNKEVAYWLEQKSPDTLLIAVTDGELAWDNTLGGFAWHDSMPLPTVLMSRFASEPKWVDLTAYRDGANPRDAKFTELAADVAAAIHGIPKEDLLSQEVRQQRRALTLAWSAAGSLMILVAVAGWQWKTAVDAEHLAVKQLNRAVAAEASATEQKDIAHEQKDIAQTQRDLAVRNFGIAKQAANHVVFRIAQDLREVQGMRVESVRRILDAAQGMMDELTRAAPDDLPLQRSRAAMLSEFAITYRGAGDLTHARAAAEESVAIMRKLAAADPGNAGWQRDLSVSLNRVGDVRLAAGDQAAALAAYEESSAIGRKLAAADPGNAGWQRDLSISLDNVGDRRLGTGHRPAARAAYEESLAIRRKLAAADPGNTEWQAELVISLFKVSTAADPPRPRAALREARAIVERLAREGKLTAAQKNWPQSLRDAIAKLPPEAAEAR